MNEYTKINWQDGTVLQQAKVTIDGTDYEVTPAVESGTTPVNATNLNKMDTALKQAHDGVRDMEVNKINKATIELLTVDSTAPEHCNIGDLYYNTTTNFIYTAIGTDTWGTTGETPSNKYLYVDLTNSKLYYYDGTNFTSYGGGSSNDVVISPDQPTGDDWKIWIDSDEVGSAASEITNSYSTSTGVGYSANYTNNLFNWEHRTVSLTPNTSPTSNYGTCDLYINHASKIVYFIIKHTTLAYESGANGAYYTNLKPYSTDSSTHLEFPIVIDKDTIGRMQLRADGGFRVYAVKAGTFVGQGMFVYDEELTS